MTAKKVEVDLVRPLIRYTSVAAMVSAVLLTLGTPMSLYLQLRQAQIDRADSYARQLAGLVREVVTTQPRLWYYDTPKLARNLHLLVEAPDVEHVVVIDTLGRRVDVQPGAEPSWWSMRRWAEAPVYRGHDEVARVWVAVDASEGLGQVLLVLLLSFVLGTVLSTALYSVPVSMVGQAERRIRSLLEKLEAARSSLAELNAELEDRVEQRSRQLAQTAEALQKSESKLREVAGRAVEATEQERQRVARELHDGVGQMLTALQINLEVMNATLEPGSPAKAQAGDTARLVAESIDELRRIAMNLHPAALDRLGLIEGLGELCQSVASSARLDITFEADELPRKLPTAVETSCYRLVQEGLNNIVRYAEARTVEVDLTLDEGTLTVRVSDDGIGFDPDSPSRGLGLRGMQDRAALLGSTLSLESSPGAGTTIEAIIPLTPPEKD